MRAPSKNISNSLRGQSPPGRGAEMVSQSRPKSYGPSMTIPGEGGVEMAPGTGMRNDGRQERSASKFAGAAGKHVGAGS